MSLSRQAGRASGRTLAVAAVVACVVGLALGFALGRLLAPEPTLADKVADLRTKLAPAREGIELSATEYAQAVRNGRVVAPTEYSAAKADVQRAADALATSRADLRALGATEAAAGGGARGAGGARRGGGGAPGGGSCGAPAAGCRRGPPAGGAAGWGVAGSVAQGAGFRPVVAPGPAVRELHDRRGRAVRRAV